MEFVMTGRSMLLASAVMVASGVWAGSAGAAPIHADMSLQGGAVFEQVQHRGPGSGGNRGSAMSSGRSSGSGMSIGRSSGGAMSFNRSGGNWSGNRAISGGSFTTNNRQSFAATNRPGNMSSGNWSGRRHFTDRRHRGFRGPSVALGFGPGYYDYGYDYGYDDGAYAYVAPGAGVAVDDSVAYCQQRFRSYDPSTGTYIGYDGLPHPCP
jgi:hypothetical protein